MDEDAVASLDPNASDQEIAEAVADYLLNTLAHARSYHLSIFHDVRPSTQQRLERRQLYDPGYKGDGANGPCPLPYDWSYKNIVGISTRDDDRARKWIIDAMLAGYSVSRLFSRRGGGFGRGSITAIRQRQSERTVVKSNTV